MNLLKYINREDRTDFPNYSGIVNDLPSETLEIKNSNKNLRRNLILLISSWISNLNKLSLGYQLEANTLLLDSQIIKLEDFEDFVGLD